MLADKQRRESENAAFYAKENARREAALREKMEMERERLDLLKRHGNVATRLYYADLLRKY